VVLLETHLKVGARAIQPTPVFDRQGRPIGVISTYYGTPHRPDVRTLGLLDLLAAQVADIVQKARREAPPCSEARARDPELSGRRACPCVFPEEPLASVAKSDEGDAHGHAWPLR
jgi:hypothetical protein